jgi:hypothetical protein
MQESLSDQQSAMETFFRNVMKGITPAGYPKFKSRYRDPGRGHLICNYESSQERFEVDLSDPSITANDMCISCLGPLIATDD